MSASLSKSATPAKGWTLSLWVVQVLLAVMFGMAGLMKSTSPFEQLAANLPWVAQVSPLLVRFIGVSELIGALGLILPAATRILPFLTPLAGGGLVTVMVLAAGYHAMHGEFGGITFNVVLGGLAAYVTWGRLAKAPISPRK